jgi:hypothetical protein
VRALVDVFLLKWKMQRSLKIAKRVDLRRGHAVDIKINAKRGVYHI